MEYFFDDAFNNTRQKQVLLLKLSLLGLTSYYPIDRSSIVNMPEVVEPKTLPLYSNYSIVNNINIIPCYMTYQFNGPHMTFIYKHKKTKKFNRSILRNLYNDALNI